MRLPDYFISCDWGTTNFRLRLVETATLKVVEQHSKGVGIKPLNQQFLAKAKGNRQEFFSNYLSEQLGYLPLEYRGAIVVVSGMASSNIGMLELPYATFPFDGSGKDLNWQSLQLRTGQVVILVSGVQSDHGMMRGEEVQAIGMEEHLWSHKNGILLLPGTHSKHLAYKEGRFTDLKNFMSGELFELLSRQSILAHSVQEGSWKGASEKMFIEGVQIGFAEGLSANLFGIRARDVLQHAPKDENYWLLSGLLIGDELGYLRQEKRKVFLAAGPPLFRMYSLAMEAVFKPGRWMVFDGKILEHALLAGQLKLLKRYGG